MPQLDVAEPDILQGLQPADNFRLLRPLVLAKELDGLVYGHLEDVVDVCAAIFHVEDVLPEAFPVASLAFEGDVGHKLHLDGNLALALALFAASAFLVEGEKGRCEAELFGQRLLAEEFADFVVCSDVGNRVGARAFSDAVLVHELDGID